MQALGCQADRDQVVAALARSFARVFDRELRIRENIMIDVIMPQMGESIVEGTLTKWLKKPGETVERDEPLFEISTDKVDTEIPSPVAGTLGRDPGAGRDYGRHQHRSGKNQRWRGRSRSSAGLGRSGPRSNGSSTAPRSCRAAQARACDRRTRRVSLEETAGPLSPLVRKMARENNIDLSQVRGTGAGGRITKQDLEAYLESRTAAPAPACRSAGASRASATTASSSRTRRYCGAAASSAAATHASCRAGSGAGPFPRRSPCCSCRAHERDAPEDRRAHGLQQTHLGACDHGAQGRHDPHR